MKILITGAGSVMGQSIYKALALHPFESRVEAHVGNSDELGAALYFQSQALPIVARPILPLAKDDRYSETVINYVKKNHIDIVFAGTQHELANIARISSEGIKCATLSPPLVDLCLDKASSMKVLAASGIRVPQTQRLSNFIVDPSVLGPGIIKPNTSSASRGLLLFESAKSIDSKEIESRSSGDYIVQERLIGDEYTCGCYLDRYSGEMSTISMRRTLTPDGATSFGEIIHNADIDNYVRSVAEALKQHDFNFGHINVQLILDSKGPCLFEINGRLSSTEAPKAKFGFNSSAAYLVNLVDEKAYSNYNVPASGKFLRYYDEVYW